MEQKKEEWLKFLCSKEIKYNRQCAIQNYNKISCKSKKNTSVTLEVFMNQDQQVLYSGKVHSQQSIVCNILNGRTKKDLGQPFAYYLLFISLRIYIHWTS